MNVRTILCALVASCFGLPDGPVAADVPPSVWRALDEANGDARRSSPEVRPRRATTDAYRTPPARTSPERGTTIPTTERPVDGGIRPVSATVEARPAGSADSAGDPAGAAVEETDELADLEAALAKVGAEPDLDPEVAAELKKRYEQAIKYVKLSRTARRTQEEWRQETADVATTAKQVREELASPMPDVTPVAPADATLGLLEAERGKAEALRVEAERALEEKTAELKRRAERRIEIPKLVEQTKKQLADLEESRKQEPGDMDSRAGVARRAESRALERALRDRLPLLEAELVRIDALAELAPLRLDLAKRRLEIATKRVEAWEEVVAAERRRESQLQAEQARRELANAHPAVRKLAERNAELAETRTGLVEMIEPITAERDRVRGRVEELKTEHESVLEKVKVAGLTTTIGLLLRNKRDHLPDVSVRKGRIRFVEEEIPRIQLLMMSLEEERAGIPTVDDVMKRVDGTPADADSAHDRALLQLTVAETIEKQRKYIGDLHNDYGTYLERLGELELASRKLIDRTDEFRGYIDENVLWIRSSDLFGQGHASEAVTGFGRLFDPTEWAGSWAAAANGSHGALLFGVLVAGLLIVVVAGPYASARAAAIGRDESRERTIGALLAQIGWTVVASIGWPTFLFVAAWCLEHNPNIGGLGRSVAYSLHWNATLVAIVLFVHHALRPHGLAETQLGWARAGLTSLRGGLALLAIVGLPAAFVVEAAHHFENGRWNESLGRAAFLVGQMWAALILFSTLGPHRRVLGQTFGYEPHGWQRRIVGLGVALLIAVPVLLAVLALFGYYYTAGHLAGRFATTIGVLVGLIAVTGLLSGWTRSVGVRLQRLKKRLLAEARRRTGDDVPTDPPAFDPDKLDSQLRRLLQMVAAAVFVVCCYGIWVEVLPALGVLDRVELWASTVPVTEEVPTAEGGFETVTVERRVPTTLGHLLVAGLVMIAAVVATRSLPGLLEILVVQRLGLDEGARNAVVTLARYAVLVAAVVTGCWIVGARWESVQWLVAAMSLGLGFGLQEIIANFVSGLIILFEQPIRVGDIVTVGGNTGRVSRVRIRATTIVDFDRRELIIPNKRFITDELVNWTLSDPVTRVVVPVGIAYGSDTRKAHDLLLEVARNHPLILAEPLPASIFTSFGDSTLNFELRFFIPRRDEFPRILHEVNLAIDESFRAANIEIAFPQQDLHIRSIEGLTAEGVARIFENRPPTDRDGSANAA